MSPTSSPHCLPNPGHEPTVLPSVPIAWLVTGTGLRRPLRCPCTLGRAATNSLPLADEQLSRRHAMISKHGEEEFWLTDNASRNGTFLNGRRIRQPERLFDQDRIRVGRSELTFHAVGVPQREGSLTTAVRGEVIVGSFGRHWLMLVEISADGLDPVSHQKGLEECRRLVEARGGMVDRYITDGLLAEWPDRGSSAAAVAGALADLKGFQADPRLTVSLVLHWGLAADSPAGALLHAGLNGPAVLQVLRMQRLLHGLAERILVSSAAAEHLRHHLTLKTACDHELPGTVIVESFLTL